MTAPYRYETLDGSHFGTSHARGRARQQAADLARRTFKTVELVDPGRGIFQVSAWTRKRAKWSKVEGRAT